MFQIVLDTLIMIVAGVPLAVIIVETGRKKQEARFGRLAFCYTLFVLNQMVFLVVGDAYYFFLVTLDCLVLCLAVHFFIRTDFSHIFKQRDTIGLTLAQAISLIGTLVAFVLNYGRTNIFFLAGINIFVFAFVHAFLLFTRLEGDAYRYLLLILFWIISRFGYITPHFSVGGFTTLLLMTALATYVLIWQITAQRALLSENAFLVRAREIVLSMLHRISTSVKEISSIDYTLECILETIIETLRVDGAAVFQVEERVGEDVLVFTRSFGVFWPIHAESDQVFTRKKFADEALARSVFEMGNGVVGEVAENRHHLILDRDRDANQLEGRGVNTRIIRNLMAVPLQIKQQVFGVLVVQNKKGVNQFDGNDLHLLQSLADQAAVSINNVRIYAELAATERLKQEMRIAARIQREMLPAEVPDVEGLAIAPFLQPAKEVGGDYYDFFQRPDGALGCTIGDVSGKGLPAGIFMTIAHTVLHMVAKAEADPRTIIIDFSREMFSRIRRGNFMTLNFLVWQPRTKELVYCGAGHEYLLWYHAESGVCERVKCGGVAVGLLEKVEGVAAQNTLSLAPGDVVVLYTDGITEAKDRGGEMYTLKRLQDSVLRHGSKGNHNIIRDAIIADVNAFSDQAEQYDDMTLLVLSAE